MARIGPTPATVYAVSEGERFNMETTLVAVTCSACGVLYAIPARFDAAARRYHGQTANGWDICCPFGHTWHYVGESDFERERRLKNWARDLAAVNAAERDQARASLRTTKGVVTKLRKRAANGVCPCCSRTFTNVRRHVARMHPDYLTEASK